jgi:hypothetical protein
LEHIKNKRVIPLGQPRTLVEYRELIIAREGVLTPCRLVDPDGNRVRLAAPKHDARESSIQLPSGSRIIDTHATSPSVIGASPSRVGSVDIVDLQRDVSRYLVSVRRGSQSDFSRLSGVQAPLRRLAKVAAIRSRPVPSAMGRVALRWIVRSGLPVLAAVSAAKDANLAFFATSPPRALPGEPSVFVSGCTAS